MRRIFGPLPRGVCSPKCNKANQVADDEAELLAEKICQTLMQEGVIDDYDCDAVNAIKPLLKPL